MEENGLTITIESLLDCEVVALDGELDQQTAPKLSEALTRAARHGKRVVVDLSDLRFIDSSGLHILLSGAGMDDGRRAIVCPPGNVARVLSIVRADVALHVYEHLDEAIDNSHS